MSPLSSGKIDKYENLTGEEVLPLHQRRVIEQTKFTCSLLGIAFEKQTKTIDEQWKKQIDASTNQNKRLEVLTNKNDYKTIYKEIFDRVVKERFDEIKDWIHEIDRDTLIHCFKSNNAKKTEWFWWWYRAF